MSEQKPLTLAEMMYDLIQDAQDIPHLSNREDLLMELHEIEQEYVNAERREAKAEALRDEAESVRDVARSNVRKYETWNLSPTEAEVRKRLAESQYGIADMLSHHAYKIEEDQQERKGSIMDYAGIWGPRPEGLDVVEWQREMRDE